MNKPPNLSSFVALLVAASANQRSGRAGRTSPGKCYRLYPHSSFTSFPDQTPPEISRTPLSTFILTMKALGIDNIMKFDLLTPPSVEAMCFALEELFAVGAIDKTCALIPGIGDLLAEFPVEVKLGRSLLASFDYGCVEEVISIAAASQVNNVFHFARSASQKRERDAAVSQYVHNSGDHLTFAKIFDDNQWKDGNICRERFLNYRALQKANEVRNQLRGFCRRLAGGIARLPSIGVGEEEVSREGVSFSHKDNTNQYQIAPLVVVRQGDPPGPDERTRVQRSPTRERR